MTSLTLKHDRKMQYAKARQKREAEADSALMASAIKAYYHKALPAAPSPQQEVDALEWYIDSMIALRRELEAEHGGDPDWKRALMGISVTLTHAADLLVRTRIRMIKDQRPDSLIGRL